MTKGPGFNPTEIIFSVTDACNLHCPHCYVSRKTQRLKAEEAKKFIQSAKNSSIERIGFSGGEPFLYTDFLCEIIKETVQNDLMFDRIMTNGVWWKDEDELSDKLKKIYDAGFDGKIGLSLDSFHNQNIQEVLTFIRKAFEIFNTGDIIEIQSVISENPEDKILDFENFDKIAEEFNLETELYLDKKTGRGTIILSSDDKFIQIQRETQSFLSEDSRAWKAKKWFKDDFCFGPGQVLFIHSDGNIAPCCGFSNENPRLFIGTVRDSLSQIMKNASDNPMIKIIYEEGLSGKIKKLKKKVPGKTTDICAFCDFVCKNI